MRRSYILRWLTAEAADGPVADAPFALEILHAINSDSDDISTEAIQWLGRMTNGSRKWKRQASACFDLIDTLCQRDNSLWSDREAPPESGVVVHV
jgi:hypothetical protein